MKKTNIIYLLLLVLCWGCDDFLEESSQNLMRPGSVDNLEEILIGDGYGDADQGMTYVTHWFTDEVKCDIHFSAKNRMDVGEVERQFYDKYKSLYQFDRKMFTPERYGYNEILWHVPYRRILGCNIVLDFLDEMIKFDDLEDVKKGNSLRGETLALRAWCYLHLVNMYGVAYNQGNPETDLAVPLVTSSQFEFAFPRATVAKVYEQIEKDLLLAIELLENNPKKAISNLRIQADAAKAILARVYLYQERWDEAIQYSKEVLDKNSNLIDYSKLELEERVQSGKCWSHNSTNECYLNGWSGNYEVAQLPYDQPYNSPEVIWSRLISIGKSSYSIGYYGYGPYLISSELASVFGDNGTALAYKGGTKDGSIKDLRSIRYFSWVNWQEVYAGTHCTLDLEIRKRIEKGGMDGGFYQGIRTAELYLNMAEAYAQKFANGGTTTDRDMAIKYLNDLRITRFNPLVWEEEGKVEASDFTDAQALISFCIDERWRELCGETNHRYCDLRRYGMTIEHKDNIFGGSYQQDMSKFVLPIPQQILESDLSVKSND